MTISKIRTVNIPTSLPQKKKKTLAITQFPGCLNWHLIDTRVNKLATLNKKKKNSCHSVNRRQ